jgi:hypothetical protein
MRRETEQMIAEARRALLRCRRCGEPVALEEYWDVLNPCGPVSCVDDLLCVLCGIGPESPYRSTVTYDPARATR